MEFTSRGLFSEQLRHLLARNTPINLDLLPTLFLTQFHKPQDPNVYDWLRKPLKQAKHVIQIAAEDLVIWSPIGRPYPDTRRIEQSQDVPLHLRADLDELLAVPDDIASHYMQMVEEPLPSAIDLDFLEPETIQMLMEESEQEQPNVDLEMMKDLNLDEDDFAVTTANLLSFEDIVAEVGHKTEEDDDDVVKTKYFVEVVDTTATNTNDTFPISGAQHQSNSSTANGVELDVVPTVNMVNSTDDSRTELPPSQGLSYGQFAGMTPDSVVELMRADINAIPDDDTKGKVQAMQTYIDYFGELSAREIERVEGPQKPRTKGKRKRELAIRFPGQSSGTDHHTNLPSVDAPDNQDTSS